MTVTFLILAALTIAGTVAAMAMRNLIHCVLALTLGFAGLASLYLQLGAQFVGLYPGPRLRRCGRHPRRLRHHDDAKRPPAAQSIFSSLLVTGSVVAAAVFAVLAWAICSRGSASTSQAAAPQAACHPIGDALMHAMCCRWKSWVCS